jgi:hypothetical protein
LFVDLSAQKLPSDLNLIRRACCINWNKINQTERNIFSDFIIRLTSDCIYYEFDEGPNRMIFKEMGLQIAESIEGSGILNDDAEAKAYFDKFRTHLREI